MAKTGSIHNFHANFRPLGFRTPRWFKVDHNLFNPAKWARSKIKEIHTHLSKFKKK